MFDRTPAFEAYIAPARRYPAIWRLVLGLLTGLAVYMGLAFAIIAFGIVPASYIFPELEGVDGAALMFSEDSTPGQMFIVLATFIGMAVAALAMCLWHWRGLRSLLGPRTDFGRYFLIAIGVLLGIQVINSILSLFLSPHEVIPHLDLATWATYLPWAIPLLFIQTTAEELVFRGYIQQQVAARFQHWFWWMVLPSLLFGLGHFDNTIDPVLAYMIVFATTLFGVVAADLTRITGNLAAAMGLHFANNFLALLIVGVPGELSGLALFHTPFTMDDVEIVRTYLLIDITVLTVIWITLRRVLR
ncbi:hypothetical protein C8N43_2475 [Litoreibacter ponti]|uniref:CAAX prenyl protease 2/Lysostaphin resistance protein A-like domain-containing protein n=1 Tax=Litoreibacter ponti TaxID=1510457 RepID=A0A2T6BNZ2_9RHOB|nr:CPBP family intramembrane glutamic endopeptidase [Litoreibacter ponti]PTX57803.1 hypothetical protein C8N43_2475 [Litoreibacter ponti]